MTTKAEEDDLLLPSTGRTRGRAPKQRGWVGLPLLVAVTAVLLVIPAVSAGSWTQAGSDASRASYNPVSGPTTDDVAFQVRMPGYISDDFIRAPMGPLIHDGSAYVHVRALGNDGAEALGMDLHGVVRVDLETAEVERFVDLGENEDWRRVAGMAMDDERLYLSSFTWPDFERVEAYRLSDGALEWTWGSPDLHDTKQNPAREVWLQGCAQPAVVDGTVYHWCNQRASDGDSDHDTGDRRDAIIVALDAETGDEEWNWTTQDDAWRTRGLQEEDPNPRAVHIDTELMGLAVVGDFVVAPSISFRQEGVGVGCGEVVPCTRGSAFEGNLSLLALDRAEGTFEWSYGVEAAGVGFSTLGERRTIGEPSGGVSVHPTGDSGEVFVRILDRVIKLNPHRGEDPRIWSEPIGEEDAETAMTLGGFAMDEEAVYTTSTQTIYRFGRENPSNQWRTSLDPGGDELFLWGGLMAGEDTLYAAAARRDASGSNGTTLYAMDKTTGEILWRHEIPYDPEVEEYKPWNQNHYHSLADGRLVVGGGDGSLRVIGETQASLGPFLVTEERYPSADEEVVVDLSGTGPGALGPPTKYRVQWGDGTDTDWTQDPLLRHTYEEDGEFVARLMVGNEANQTASTQVTMHVGEPAPIEGDLYPPVGENVTLNLTETGPGLEGTIERYRVFWGDGTISGWQSSPVFTHAYGEAGNVTARLQVAGDNDETASGFLAMHVGATPPPEPPEPTLLQKAFAPGNQDMTFGVLGILVAVTGGAVGVTQRYRKRSRLQDELEAVERAYEATKDRPLECEAQLTERKTHARGLVLDGELDEQQFGVVEQRIEELLKGVRMGAMEDEFDFLPHGLVKRAREMLADGTVSSLEREAFLQAVEEDEMLSSRQKAVVRDRIEAWHARDAGGGGGSG